MVPVLRLLGTAGYAVLRQLWAATRCPGRCCPGAATSGNHAVTRDGPAVPLRAARLRRADAAAAERRADPAAAAGQQPFGLAAAPAAERPAAGRPEPVGHDGADAAPAGPVPASAAEAVRLEQPVDSRGGHRLNRPDADHRRAPGGGRHPAARRLAAERGRASSRRRHRRTDHRAQPRPGAGRRSAAVGPDADAAAGRALLGAWRPVPAGHPVPDRRARRRPAARPRRRPVTRRADRPPRSTGSDRARDSTDRAASSAAASPARARTRASPGCRRTARASSRRASTPAGSTGRPPTRRASTALPSSARASSRPASTASTSTAPPRSSSRSRTVSTDPAVPPAGPTAVPAVPAGSTVSPARTDPAASSARTGHRWPSRSAR